eukprot:GHVU01146384.1.p2 GENE.GHVU01146384.1~~GHVU01146384.1.p2  ORF type:complete len:103 (+),score=30.25 GHVU01146384.1:659-967(+)
MSAICHCCDVIVVLFVFLFVCLSSSSSSSSSSLVVVAGVGSEGPKANTVRSAALSSPQQQQQKPRRGSSELVAGKQVQVVQVPMIAKPADSSSSSWDIDFDF